MVTKEFLIAEKAGLEQRKLKIVEQARNDLEAVGGALQFIEHCLKQFGEPKAEATENRNEEKS